MTKRVCSSSLAAILSVLACAGCSTGVAEATDDAAAQSDEAEIRGAAASNTAAVGRALTTKLKPLAPKVTLGLLGEDSGSACSVSFRKGPIATFDRDGVLRAFGFDVASQVASDDFSFVPRSKADTSFWSELVDSQDDDAKDAAKQIRALFTGADIEDVATMVVHDKRAFTDPAFLVARASDGSLVALRGDIGGQGL